MSSSNRNSSKSRAVLQKAAAYSVAYFVTWIWLILYVSLILVGAWTSELPQPKWQIGYVYAWSFFGPLQGLWTFLIYMQPKVIKKRRSSNVSWFGAFADAL